jgi:hypothetical protein
MFPIGSFLYYNPPCTFLFSRPCSGNFPPKLFIDSYYNPPYPYPSSSPAYIYVHFPYPAHFNPKDGGSTILQNTGIHLPHYTPQQPKKPQIRMIHVDSLLNRFILYINFNCMYLACFRVKETLCIQILVACTGLVLLETNPSISKTSLYEDSLYYRTLLFKINMYENGFTIVTAGTSCK